MQFVFSRTSQNYQSNPKSILFIQNLRSKFAFKFRFWDTSKFDLNNGILTTSKESS